MKTDLKPADWKLLRFILRASRGGNVKGWLCRTDPSRRTKDGTFLTDLVEDGLLKDDGPCDPPGKDEPVTQAVRDHAPFHRYYQITALGREAAEYGEYTPPEKPRAESPKPRAEKPKGKPGRPRKVR